MKLVIGITSLYITSSLALTGWQTSFANLESTLENCRSDITKTCNVAVGASSTTGRLGLIATSNIRKGDILLNMPYDDRYQLTASTARNEVFKGIMSDKYEGWTGDAGLIALMLLNEVARVDGAGLAKPERPPNMQSFMEAWVQSMPSPDELKEGHPLMWSEADQEVLQSSSNTKIYQKLDDLEEDATWLVENIFDKDRKTFPETVQFNGQEIPCFSTKGYAWAMALTQSRAVFTDTKLRLLPMFDVCNHNDGAVEISGGYMGTFKTTQGAQLLANQAYKEGEEVFCSYGPKSAADYLLEHGFCPPLCWKSAVSEITLELDPEDRFYDDKLDVLEFETYDQAPMDPSQSFDVVSVPGRDGEPDPAMIQFARLRSLGGQDAFLLESIFRKEVWDFMSLPVSEPNELKVVTSICSVIEKALEELQQCPEGGLEVCTQLRESETKALKRTLEYLEREKQALDLKEYYQERRLKDLGLDSEWAPEDDMGMDDDVGFGATRAPGGADYDW
ncbi:MAG: hypothetical protein SGBAC_010408 [Bacillariaceae sp.]